MSNILLGEEPVSTKHIKKSRFSSKNTSPKPYSNNKGSNNNSTSDTIIIDYMLALDSPDTGPSGALSGEIAPSPRPRGRPSRCIVSVSQTLRTTILISPRITRSQSSSSSALISLLIRDPNKLITF